MVFLRVPLGPHGNIYPCVCPQARGWVVPLRGITGGHFSRTGPPAGPRSFALCSPLTTPRTTLTFALCYRLPVASQGYPEQGQGKPSLYVPHTLATPACWGGTVEGGAGQAEGEPGVSQGNQ